MVGAGAASIAGVVAVAEVVAALGVGFGFGVEPVVDLLVVDLGFGDVVVLVDFSFAYGESLSEKLVDPLRVNVAHDTHRAAINKVATGNIFILNVF